MVKCKICGVPFEKSGKRVFCSPDCRHRAYVKVNLDRTLARSAKRKRVRDMVTRRCVVCCATFLPVNTSNKYCSVPCAETGRATIRKAQALRRKITRRGRVA